MPRFPAQFPGSRPFWLLGVLMGQGTLGVHVFVPALPLIALDFGVSEGATRATISLYMSALAVGQLVVGPISDRVGRRPALFGALTLYILAGIAVVSAQSLGWLVAARVLQALGGAGGLVIARTVINDTSTGDKAAGQIAKLNATMLLASAIAPAIGAVFAQAFGWPAVGVLLTGIGIFALTTSGMILSETLPRDTVPTSAGETVRRYSALIGSPAFIVNVVGGSLCTATLFALLASAPFVFTGHFGRSVGETGYFNSVFIAGIILGSLIVNPALGRLGFRRLTITAALLGTVAGGVLLESILTGTLTLWLFLLCGFGFTLMAGIMGPLALTMAVTGAGPIKGSAAGFYGFIQFNIGAGAVWIAGIGSDTLLTSALTLAGSALLGLVIFTLKRSPVQETVPERNRR